MKTCRLTQQAIKHLKPAKRAYVLWDTVQQGLGVKVLPSDRTSYVVRASIAGKVRNKTLAPTDALTVHAARIKTQEQLSAWRGEGDNRPITTSPRFDAFVNGLWTQQRLSQWKPGTQRSVRSALNARLLPTFGCYPLHIITHAAIQQWFAKTSRTQAGAANRNLDILQSIFKLAVVHGYCQDNPVAGIRQNKRRVLNRFLSLDEIKTLSEVLQQASQRDENGFQCSDIVRLLLLTGCRVSEIAGLRWSWIQGHEIHLPDSKTGARVVYLGDAALAILAQHPNAQGDAVFPCVHGQPRLRISHFWYKVRQQAGLTDVRLHDLRHTFASVAVMEGHSLPMVAKLLGHKKLSMTLRYTHVGDDTVEAAAEKVGCQLHQMASGAASLYDTSTTPLAESLNHEHSKTIKREVIKRLTVTFTHNELKALWQCAEKATMTPEAWSLACIREGARIESAKDRYNRYREMRIKHKRYHQPKRQEKLVLTFSAVSYAYYQSIANVGRLTTMQWVRVVLLDQLTAEKPLNHLASTGPKRRIQMNKSRHVTL